MQTATGFNVAEAQAAGVEGPKELPCQALDHATGYLLAFGAIMARMRQASEGGSWLVRVVAGCDRTMDLAIWAASRTASHAGCHRATTWRICLKTPRRRSV